MFRATNCVLWLLCLLLTGCLEFDAQEVTMRYDAKADRIDFLLVYRGVFYESGTNDNLDKAFEDYAEVLSHGQAFFWSNWPLKVDVVDPPRTTAALAEHVEVEIGGLFTGPTGRLDGYQFVRITRAGEFLTKLNTMLELAVQGALLTGFDDHKFDDDTRELVREFLREKQRMVSIEAGRIVLQLPCSPADFSHLLARLEQYFAGNAASEIVRATATAAQRAADPSDTTIAPADAEVAFGRTQLRDAMSHSPSFRFFWDNPISIVRGQELQTIAIGLPDSSELTVVKASDGHYSDNFLNALRERGEKIESGVPDQEIRRRFDDFLTRAAKLPAELEARRDK
ncbi:MAG: hypothetical protein KDE27_23055 [Planctomycetes bacterium]|nr:hypothetical protein [Planctomycetota bacterium]